MVVNSRFREGILGKRHEESSSSLRFKNPREMMIIDRNNVVW